MDENVFRTNIKVTVRNIIRVLSTCAFILVFCPMFLVSCSGAEVEISAMKAISGMKMYGQELVKPQPILLICLFLPIAILVVLFLKNIKKERVTTFLVTILAIIDMVIWIVFRISVEKYANENYCSFETTPWFTWNIIVWVLITALAVSVYYNILHLDNNLIDKIIKEDMKKTMTKVTDTMGMVSNKTTRLVDNTTNNVHSELSNEAIVGYCPKCGKGQVAGNKYCTSCGIQLPESIYVETEHRKATRVDDLMVENSDNVDGLVIDNTLLTKDDKTKTENTKYCKGCGKQFGADVVFCKYCGMKQD